MVCTWLGEIRSLSCLAVLPDSAWVLLNNICQPFFTSLYVLAGEQKFSHVLIPQDVVFVEPEFAVFHVGLAGVDLQKRAKKQ